MNTFIVLLRGVMPTGKNKVPMARLRTVLAGAGFGNVRTYIQSGNAVVDTALPAEEVEEQVHELIRKKIGPDLVVVARTAAQLKKALSGNPFENGFDPSRLFFVSFKSPPPPAKAKALVAGDYGVEKLAIKGRTAYLSIPGTYGKGILSASYLERKLGVPATMRNLNTMKALIAMASGKEA